MYDPISEADCLLIRIQDIKNNILKLFSDQNSNKDILANTIEMIKKIKAIINTGYYPEIVNSLEIKKENKQIMS